MFFDSHAHLDDEKFDGDRFEVASSLPQYGIEGILNVCSSLKTLTTTLELIKTYSYIYGAVGIHPHEASLANNDIYENLIRECSHSKIIAYGEIGLDYHYNFSPKEVQKRVFEEQINIAYKLNLPLIIHNREAHQDVLDILTLNKDRIKGGMMHMFSGSWETAKRFLDLGFYISLGGPVTFKNAVTPVEIARNVPLDRLLIETDCPYMAPHPLRGTRNSPVNVSVIARKISEIRGITITELTQSLGTVLSMGRFC